MTQVQQAIDIAEKKMRGKQLFLQTLTFILLSLSVSWLIYGVFAGIKLYQQSAFALFDESTGLLSPFLMVTMTSATLSIVCFSVALVIWPHSGRTWEHLQIVKILKEYEVSYAGPAWQAMMDLRTSEQDLQASLATLRQGLHNGVELREQVLALADNLPLELLRRQLLSARASFAEIQNSQEQTQASLKQLKEAVDALARLDEVNQVIVNQALLLEVISTLKQVGDSLEKIQHRQGGSVLHIVPPGE